MDQQNLNNPQPESPSVTEQAAPEGSSNKADEKKQKKEPAVIFKTGGTFILTDEVGKEIESGSAKFILDEEKISIFAEGGKATLLFLKEIGDFFVQDYKISLSLFKGGKILLSDLGYEFTDFVKALTRLRHDIIQKDLLMNEGGKKAGFRGYYD